MRNAVLRPYVRVCARLLTVALGADEVVIGNAHALHPAPNWTLCVDAVTFSLGVWYDASAPPAQRAQQHLVALGNGKPVGQHWPLCHESR